MRYPFANKYPVTSNNGEKYADYIIQQFPWLDYHLGYDIAAPINTPVMSPEAGNAFVNSDGDWELHGNGLIWIDAHVKVVKVGQVKEGEVVSYVSEGGVSVGVHLHRQAEIITANYDPTSHGCAT